MKVWWENVTVNKEGNIALLHQTFVHQTTSSKTSSSSATSSNTTAKRRTTAVNRRPPAGDEGGEPPSQEDSPAPPPPPTATDPVIEKTMVALDKALLKVHGKDELLGGDDEEYEPDGEEAEDTEDS